MADDGMLMNFELTDAPFKPQTAFKGGSWKARLAANKSEKRRQSRGSQKPKNPQAREIFDRATYENKREEHIGANSAERAPKRQRVVEGRNAATASVISGKLPAGSISLGGGLGKKKVFGDEVESREVEGRNVETARHISGKLPPGSISTGRREIEGRNVETARHISGTLPPGSISTGRNRDGAGGKPQQVISSLYTFNPTAKRTFEHEPAEKAEPAKPSNAPLTEEIANFVDLGLSRRLAAHLSTKMELKAPTAVQKAAIPQLIKDDSDVFIQAQTGSGKTLAYLLPIVERIMAMSVERASEKDKIHRNSGLFAVVLAPTRELCKQISVVLEKLLRCAPWLVSTTVVGGEGKKSEKARLRKGVNILIATPGRLADHLDNTEVLSVSSVRWLVLDEGDRLMELGFEEEIKGIVEKIRRRSIVNVDKKNGGSLTGLPKRRVTVLCSATMKMNVQRLGEISLQDAVHVQGAISEEDAARNTAEGLDPTEKRFSIPAQLKQAYAIVPAKQRLVTLTAILKRTFARRGSVMKAIIFMSCADSVDFHFSLFSRAPKKQAVEDKEAGEESLSPPTAAAKNSELIKDTTAPGTAFANPTNSVTLHKLHGSLPQNIRTATLKAFSQSSSPCVLICTDVVSRGLDLPNVDYVIEYDPPFSSDDHLHRVGRTARAGRDGRALIFLMPEDEEGYIDILASGYSDGRKSLIRNTAEELIPKGFGGTGKEWVGRAEEYQLEVERWALESPKYLEMARRAYQSHIRAYATHVASERHIFNMQTLHLGHLAKAFALRDKPGSIKVPGLRPTPQTKAERSIAARTRTKEKEEDKAPEGERVKKARKAALDAPRPVDLEDASRRMRRKVAEHMSASAEFNIG